MLLVILVPLWAAWLAFHVVQVAAHRPAVWPPLISFSKARAAGGYPIVRWILPDQPSAQVLESGDTLLRVGQHDLAGTTLPRFTVGALDVASTALPVPLTIRRGDAVIEVGLDVRRRHAIEVAPAWLVITSLVSAATGVLLLLRAPAAPAARLYFLATMSAQLLFVSFFPGPPLATYATLLARALGGAFAGPCFLQAVRLLVPATAPRTRLGLWWPFLFVPVTLAMHVSVLLDAPFSAEFALRWLDPFVWGGSTLCLLVVLARSFRLADPIGRRRIKWLLYGCYLIYTPRLFHDVLAMLGYRSSFDTLSLALSGIVLPISMLIAVARYNLLDIDRLISVTASYTTLTVLAVSAVLIGFPRAAALASEGIGIAPAGGQLVFAVGLAAVLVPAHRRLRPQIDRLFFTERHALERGVAAVLRELSDCSTPEVLYVLIGKRLDTAAVAAEPRRSSRWSAPRSRRSAWS